MNSSVRSALFLALAGFSLLSLGDAVVKTMAGQWPGSAVAALRYSAGAVGLAIAVGLAEGRKGFALPRPGIQLGRGAAIALATICFFLGVMALPLADATAIQFTSPILTALLAPWVLRERTHPSTWIATLLAFCGVLIVLRPNLVEAGMVAFYPLGAAFGMSWLVMLNRKAAGAASPLAMQYLAAIMAAPMLVAAAAILAATGSPTFAVPVPSLAIIAKCLLVACTATLGHLLIFRATVRASAAVVAPMTYVQLLIAAALGWLVFGHAPDLSTLAGAALIILAGLALFRAQRPREVPEPAD